MPFRRETWEHETARWLYIIVVIISALVMAVLFVLLENDRNSINREANIRATQIQQQRYDTIYGNCVDQNSRNTNTIKKLRHIGNVYVKQHPAMAVQIKASIANNIVLINALVPKHNCRRVAARAVHPLENPNGR